MEEEQIWHEDTDAMEKALQTLAEYLRKLYDRDLALHTLIMDNVHDGLLALDTRVKALEEKQR